MITLVVLNNYQLKQPCLYCLPNHPDKGKSISLLQRVQGCCSLLIIVHDKNLEFTTKLRVTICYLLVLIYYLAVVFHMVHTFYILSTYSNLSTISQSLSCLHYLSSVLSPFIIGPVSCYFPRLVLSLLLCPIFFNFPSPVFAYSITRLEVL